MTKHSILFLFAILSSAQVWAQAATLSAPNISSNLLLIDRNTNYERPTSADSRNGFDFQEAELQFYADVDPYSRLNLLLTVGPQYTLNTVTGRVDETWTIEPEEAFVESNVLPAVTFKLGKFKALFGKHNILHSHAYPLIDAPIINTALLGDEGLNDVGGSAATLLPTSWFSEVTLQFFRAGPENAEFVSPSSSNMISLAHWKNLFDLQDSLTMEFGVSAAEGGNSYNSTTKLTGADLTFKWRPMEGGRFYSGIFGAEYINRRVGQNMYRDEVGEGVSIFAGYQFAERWSTFARYETLRVEGTDPAFTSGTMALNQNPLTNDTTLKGTLGLQFSATEFSAFSLNVANVHGAAQAGRDMDEHRFLMQANFTIGSHPAHSY